MRVLDVLNKKSHELINDQKDIDSIIYKYPYFAHAHIIKTKISFETNSILLSENLAKAALLCPDRSKLFSYIFDEIYFSNPNQNNTEDAQNKNDVTSKDIEKIKTPIKETNIKTEKTKEVNTEEKEIPKSKSTRKTKLIDDVSDKKEIEKTESKKYKAKEEIIEKFIKTNPSVSKPGEEDYSETEEQAKKSLEENLDFVSETLAEIYLKQGNKEKAVKIFKQLMLKIPEKKLYFAAQIKEIEQKL